MTRVAVGAAVFALVVLLAPGTPGERPSVESSVRGARSSASAPSAVVGRSLGVSLAAVHETTPTTDEPVIDGKNVEWWHRRALSNGRTMRQRGLTIHRLKRTLAAHSTVRDAIRLASTVYRIPYRTLNRKAWCESRYSPAARNPSGAMGLYQFLGSTWRTTPFAGFSPYDPFAASLAAGWMHLVGRGAEWSCR